MIESHKLTSNQREALFSSFSKTAFIGSRQVGHTESIVKRIACRLDQGYNDVVLCPSISHSKSVSERVRDDFEGKFTYNKYTNEISTPYSTVKFGNYDCDFENVSGIHIDNIDTMLQTRLRKFERMLGKGKITSLFVAGTPQIPSTNIDYIVNSDDWYVIFDNMENCEFIDSEVVGEMRQILSPVQCLTEIDGMVISDPSEKADYP